MADIDFGSGPGTGDTVRQALDKLQARIDAIKAGGEVPGGGGNPIVAPVFPSLPTLTPSSGQVGAQFTGMFPAATGADSYAYRMLLNGTAISSGTVTTPTPVMVNPVLDGSLIFEVTAENAAGITTQSSSPVTVTAAPVVVAPTLTLSGPLSYTAGAAFGTLVSNIGNVPGSSTPSLTPNDGRLVVSGNLSAGWKVTVGTVASSAGTIPITVSASGANAASANVTVGAIGAINLSSPLTFPANAPQGTYIGAINGVPTGVTPTLNNTGNRVAIGGDEATGWTLRVGSVASTIDTINIVVSATGVTPASGAITVTPGSGAGSGLSEFYAAEGATTVAYHNATQPPALYDAATNKTWTISEGGNSNGQRISRATVIDHATGHTDGPTLAFTSTLIDDDHGVAAIEIDSQGYVWAFGGIHNNGQPLRASVTVAPGVNVWRKATPITAIDGGYPHPTCVGSTMYVFGRQEAAADRLELALSRGALSNGDATWSAREFITNWGSDNRVYQGNHVKVGTDIYIPLIRANRADENRRNPALIIFNTLDGSVRNMAGTVVVPQASLPINATQLNDSCRIREQGGDVAGTIPQVAFHNGVLHAVFGEGVYNGGGSPGENNAGPITLLHTYWDTALNGGIGGWTAPVKFGDAVGRYSSNATIVSTANGLVAYWMDGDRNIRMNTYNAGVWGAQAPFKTRERDFPLGGPAEVRYSVAGKPRFTFSEKSPEVTDEKDDLRVYLHDTTKYYTRNNAGKLWTPLDLGAKLTAWWRPSTFSDTDTDWADVIRGNNLGKQSDPAIVMDFNGDKRAIEFDGNDYFARSGTLANAPYGANVGEIWIVGSVAAGLNGNFFAYGDSGAGKARWLRVPGSGKLAIATGATGQELESTIVVNDGSPLIARARFEPTLLSLALNGEPVETLSIAANPLNTGTGTNHRARIGANASTASTPGGILSGRIRHSIITGDLTVTEAQKLEGWLAHDSGLLAKLPAGHPYKTTAPRV